MYVITLVSHPSALALTSALVDQVAHAIGSKTVYWLSDGIAADVLISEPSHTIRTQIEQVLIGKPIDIVIQKLETRRKRVLIADMDSTMIGQECIDELADLVGMKEHVSRITTRAMNGEIPFEEALRERVALLSGIRSDIIAQVIEQRITLTSGGAELLATMKHHGGYAALVSGGFTCFTNPISQMLCFDENRANILEEEAGVFTGLVREPILGREAKADALRDICTRLDFDTDDVMAVGDGANDLAMITLAGAGVALHAKPLVSAQAEHKINFGDLTALLYMQGYRKNDFITAKDLSIGLNTVNHNHAV
jgi:phosphoserine phosphatase